MSTRDIICFPQEIRYQYFLAEKKKSAFSAAVIVNKEISTSKVQDPDSKHSLFLKIKMQGERFILLTLFLLLGFVSSVDNLCKQFGQYIGPDLDPNCLTL